MKKPLRIAILEADTPLPEVVEQFGRYDRIFSTLIEAAAEGEGMDPKKDLVLKGYDVVDKMEYPDLNDWDAILISGSKHNSYDNNEWILKLVDFTKQALSAPHIRILGICFGHQILGRALGAKVGQSDDGWEISVLPVELSSKGKEIFQQDTLAIHQMHRDIVHTYPPGVEKLGASPRCLVQGMYKQNEFISVQGHPEFTEGIMIPILKARNKMGIFQDEQTKEALKRSGDKHDGVVIMRAFLRFVING